MTCPLDALRTDLALHFETLSPAQLEHAGRLAIEDAGGILIEPRPGWGPLEVEITLYGIHASGDTLESALRIWRTRALRIHREQERAAA